MSAQDTGAGRARGRGRGRTPQQQPGQAAAAPPQAQARPAAPSAWGAPIGPPAQARPQGAGPPPGSAGGAARAGVPAGQPGLCRAMHRTAPDRGDEASVSARLTGLQVGAGGEGTAAGRGLSRGSGRTVQDILRTRPADVTSKKGTTGAQVAIGANYFNVMTAPNWNLYQYHVDIEPEEDRTFIRKMLLRDHKAKLGGYLFDGGSLYTITRLNPDPMELFSVRKQDEAKMRIMIKLVGLVSPGDYHYLQLFNVIMRSCYYGLKLQLVGRDFYNPAARVDIPEFKLQVWPGYKTTINQHEGKILMMAEVAHKVFRMDTVLEMLGEYMRRGKDARRQFREDILGTSVMTDYNSKMYRVDDVDWTLTPSSTFQMRDQQISYADYYKTKYNVKIRDMNQPMLMSRTKPREVRAGLPEVLFLVPELCRMTGLSDEMRSNFTLMKSLAKHTKLEPNLRIGRLMDFNKRLQSTPECIEVLSKWGMKLDNKILEFPGRILPQENIVQGPNANEKYPAGSTGDGWTRDMRSRPLLSCAQVTSWAVVAPARLQNDTEKFMQLIANTGRAMGFSLNRPEYVWMQGDRSVDYTTNLENVIARMNPTFILCAFTRNSTDRYEAVKKKCCVERAVPTQVVCARNMNAKTATSIATKVAIQINCKIGGAPWTVELPLKGLMVIGFDVCHDTKNKAKSYGALVASLDPAITQYFSAVNPHTSGEELSSHMNFNIGLALVKYREKNGALPSRILVYRDGVGEGQIPFVYNHEVNEMRKKLTEMYGGETYKMAFVIVSKRINTRLFLKGQNPPPGTIVDDVITLPERYDFYLVSQCVREGTVSPTSYNVIYNNIGLSPDQMQRLTYKMCHLYFNNSSHVRVPAVCQYAHKLAFLVGQSLHGPPLVSLNTSLYFL